MLGRTVEIGPEEQHIAGPGLVPPDLRQVPHGGVAQRLRAGHFGRARIALGGARELMKVPSSALVERAGVNRIYVAVDGVAEARIVEVIERAGDEVWVEGTLADGEQVLVSPGRDIADGVGIEPHPVASNQPLSTGDPNPQPNQPDPSGPRAEG